MVGPPEDLVGRLADADVGDADAGVGEDGPALDDEGSPQRLEDAVGHVLGPPPVGEPRKEHGELVAAQPGDHVPPPAGAVEPLGHHPQQLVPDVVAERVVDGLEVVEVEEQERRVHERRGGGDLGQVAAQQAPVGESGEGVVLRLVPQLLLQVGEGGERILQSSVLERHRELGSQGLEQGEVGRPEGGDVARRVTDEEDPDREIALQQWRRHRVEPPAPIGGAAAPIEERHSAVERPPHERVHEGRVDRIHHP